MFSTAIHVSKCDRGLQFYRLAGVSAFSQRAAEIMVLPGQSQTGRPGPGLTFDGGGFSHFYLSLSGDVLQKPALFSGTLSLSLMRADCGEGSAASRRESHVTTGYCEDL